MMKWLQYQSSQQRWSQYWLPSTYMVPVRSGWYQWCPWPTDPKLNTYYEHLPVFCVGVHLTVKTNLGLKSDGTSGGGGRSTNRRFWLGATDSCIGKTHPKNHKTFPYISIFIFFANVKIFCVQHKNLFFGKQTRRWFSLPKHRNPRFNTQHRLDLLNSTLKLARLDMKNCPC